MHQLVATQSQLGGLGSKSPNWALRPDLLLDIWEIWWINYPCKESTNEERSTRPWDEPAEIIQGNCPGHLRSSAPTKGTWREFCHDVPIKSKCTILDEVDSKLTDMNTSLRRSMWNHRKSKKRLISWSLQPLGSRWYTMRGYVLYVYTVSRWDRSVPPWDFGFV